MGYHLPTVITKGAPDAIKRRGLRKLDMLAVTKVETKMTIMLVQMGVLPPSHVEPLR